MSAYEFNSGNNSPKSPNNNNQNKIIDNIIDDNNKDKKIAELRSKINDLKQKEKDFDSLSRRYKQLLSDFSILNEAKLRLEYEIKQRESEYNRRITDLKGENEILQLGLNDKMTNSKKLLSENDILEREIGLKNGEINDLNGRLSNLSYQLDHTQENRNELVKEANYLKENNINQNEQIFKLKQDNICLSKICQENEKNIKIGDNDIQKLSQKFNQNNYELKNLNGKILYHEKNINELENNLNCCNEMNLKLQENIRNCEKEFDHCRNENGVLQKDILNERSLRKEKENQNEKLKHILIEKETILNQLCHDNNNIQKMNRDNDNKNKIYKIQNEKLTNQVRMLENQNQNIINEIDNILEDRKMKEVLCRKSRITSFLRDNNDALERPINNFDTYINKSYNDYNDYQDYNNYNYLPNSSRYTYQMGRSCI